MERLQRSRKMLEKQPRSLRTPELAKRVNVAAWRMSDDQKIAPLVAPWDSYIQWFTENTEEPPQAWRDLMDEIDPRDAWSITQLLGKFVSRFKFETVGDIRDFCSQEGHFLGIAPRSMAFGEVAFRRKYQRTKKA